MAQLRTLTEIYLELRDRLDEAVPGQHPPDTLYSFIRLASERVAKRTRGVRRIMPIVLDAGDRIPINKFRVFEMWDSIRSYSSWEYGRVTGIAIPNRNTVKLAVDSLENHIFTLDYADTELDLVAGETSLWSTETTTLALTNPFGIGHHPTGCNLYVGEFSANSIVELSKSDLSLVAAHTPGGLVVNLAFDPNVDSDPLSNRGFVWYTDAVNGTVTQYNVATTAANVIAGTAGAYGICIDADERYGVVSAHNLFGVDNVWKIDLDAVTASWPLGAAAGQLGSICLDRSIQVAATCKTDGAAGLDVTFIDVSGTDPVLIGVFNIPVTDYNASMAPVIGPAVFSEATRQFVFPVNDRLVLVTYNDEDYTESTADFLNMPGYVFDCKYDEITGALWVTAPALRMVFRVDLVGVGAPEYIPFIERANRWDLLPQQDVNWGSHYASVDVTVTGQQNISVEPEYGDTRLLEIHYAGLPHELTELDTPTDIPETLREAVVTEAEILALERVGRDAQWLQAKLSADYAQYDTFELERAASMITTVSAYD